MALPEVQKLCRKVIDYPDIFKVKLPSLAAINKRFGFDFTQAYIEGWIVNLREFVNVGKPMTDNQTQETAMMILENYPSLTVTDINFIFKKVKTGGYGILYDRLDGQLILSWFEKHFNDRCAAAAEISMREADKYKGEGRSTSFDKIQEMYSKKQLK